MALTGQSCLIHKAKLLLGTQNVEVNKYSIGRQRGGNEQIEEKLRYEEAHLNFQV